MESYVEISWIYNTATIILCSMLASCNSVQPIRLRDICVYAISISLFGVSLYIDKSLYCMMVLEFLFFMTMFQRRKKLYVSAMAYRWFVYLSTYAWMGGSLHNGLWFLPIDAHPLFLFMLYALVFYLLHRSWKQLIARSHYVYDAWLYVDRIKIKIKGYLDSGNLLTHEGCAVIFLDQRYQTYFDETSIQLVVMNTVEKTGLLRCYPCRIQLQGCQVHEVYVSCEKALALPFDCDVLLNLKLMTLG